MPNFHINFLDHVAIRVKDMNSSIQWYEKFIGLKKIQTEKWGETPIFMMSGNCGVALFPANFEEPEIPTNLRNVKIDHFAFNVSNEDFSKAREYFDSLGQDYYFQDHFYFHSIYLNDPDDHTVELTTLVKPDHFVYPE